MFCVFEKYNENSRNIQSAFMAAIKNHNLTESEKNGTGVYSSFEIQ